ncbi:phosphotransferase family protein [Rhodothermus profundi]|uniref:Predicted kinase, aminoglycoside phosphotransferase (APT) family n=1 Tax=Rhodothermus profundi TaxID=633813 RepID=A0A1M6QBF6_9BACT|nr:phosphotransferase family protein [Rhodothermus profundi]SHK17427.1 Predicted kinase, aminoglycoside phosphotransferase (APT) family [Rhodothermus profundi]
MSVRLEPHELSDVRPEARFNEARLAAFLRGKLPGTDQPLRVRQFTGGAANLTYLLDYGTHQYVLRRSPPGPLPRGGHDMRREYTVLSRLWQAYPLAPRAFLFCDDPEIVGTPFFVMERRHGVVVRTELPAIFQPHPDAPRRMALALVDALADLHAVDFRAIGLGELGRPAGFLERQIEGWWKRWEAARTMDLPDLAAVYTWLQANRPAHAETALVHNDYKLDNVMFALTDPGRIVAVFDWDMCTLGDPLSDLGALLAYWVRPDDPPIFRSLTTMPLDERFPTREELVARYAARRGRPLPDVRFYHVLGLYRVTVIVAQLYARFVRGLNADPRYKALGSVLPALARAARTVAEA